MKGVVRTWSEVIAQRSALCNVIIYNLFCSLSSCQPGLALQCPNTRYIHLSIRLHFEKAEVG